MCKVTHSKSTCLPAKFKQINQSRLKVNIGLCQNQEQIKQNFEQYHGPIYHSLLSKHRKFGRYVNEISEKRDSGLASANKEHKRIEMKARMDQYLKHK